ncbi:hypothetical protein [Tunicatimonas pelagia]|uniref:hypothetical protein n=1 Tax=Tunicatimonas pelagia TaxID=931531 RepID=UPI0026655B7B|nr:hypothetical protein [Tunicatimonas pelagia]WKN46484.1 hypothetical protein P0M28_30505 [Tunicatimonas pelagia]
MVVKDKKNRKEEINNAASSLGENIMWEKIRKTKEVIDETYDKIHALQDSLDQIKQMVHTIRNLGMANIEDELLFVHDIKTDIDAYVAGVPGNGSEAVLRQLYKSDHVAQAATAFTNTIYFADALPSTVEALDQHVIDVNDLRMEYSEFADKRAMQTASMYRRWGELYRNKGEELHHWVMTDNAYAVTDYERIKLQQIAQQYTVLSYRFVEKSDSILLAISNYQGAVKMAQKNRLFHYLRSKELFN